MRKKTAGNKHRSSKSSRSLKDNVLSFPARLDEPSFATDAAVAAQELIYEAWEASARKQRSQLARKALELWPDCADAYLLLAEDSRDPDEALRLHQLAVAAGERALGKQAFDEGAGHFWLIHETRPYMRARAGLAQLLELTEQYADAIAHSRELLRLNPNDNQGIRYLLLRALIAAGRDDEAWKFANESPTEVMAAWLYPKALLAFRRDGDSETAERLLREAIGRNRFVPDFLLGRKKTSRNSSGFFSLGDESEASSFVLDYALLWHRTPGAAKWLERVAR